MEQEALEFGGQFREDLAGQIGIEWRRPTEAKGGTPILGPNRRLDGERPATGGVQQTLKAGGRIGRRGLPGQTPERPHFIKIEGEIGGANNQQFTAQPGGGDDGEGRFAPRRQGKMEPQGLNGDQALDNRPQGRGGINEVVIVNHQQRVVIEGCRQFIDQSVEGGASGIVRRDASQHRADPAFVKRRDGTKSRRQMAQKAGGIIIGTGAAPSSGPTAMRRQRRQRRRLAATRRGNHHTKGKIERGSKVRLNPLAA